MRIILLLIFFFFFAALQLHAQFRFDYAQNFHAPEGLPSRHVEDFVEDEYGFIWIATRGGLCRFDGSKISVIKKTEKDSVFFNSNHIRSLFLDGDSLWLGTSKGLSIMNIKTRAVKNFRFKSDFPGLSDPQKEDDVVRDIIRDKNGDTWIIPGFNGIVKLDKTTHEFVHYPLQNSPEIPKAFGLQYHSTLFKFVQDMHHDSLCLSIMY